MSCKVCKCDVALINTGLPNCTTIHGIANRLIMVSKYDTSGTENTIPSGTTFNQAYLDAKINNADELARWYPIAGVFENVEQLREDSVYFEANSGTKRFVRKGIKNFAGMLLEFPAAYLKSLDQFKCGQWTCLIVDCDGGLVGYGDLETGMTGIPVEKATMDANFVEQTDSDVAMLKLDWQWDKSTTDANIKYIASDDITADLNDSKGLIDVVPLKTDFTRGYDVASATEFSFDAKTIFGTKVTGLVVGDFTLTNTTTASSVSITSVVESPAGLYTFTIPAQTTNDLGTLDLSKDGFSGSVLSALPITFA